MPDTPRLRFGVNVFGPFSIAGPMPEPPFTELLATALAAEGAGFEVVGLSDRPPEDNLEAWTLATALAVRTERVRVTHSTLNVPFRNPALLAKMAASLDVISGGRLDLTLGAGAVVPHFESYGIGFGSGAERFEAMADTLAILQGLWTGEPFSYEGRRHSVRDAVALPRPTGGTVPIILGARGPRMLGLAGRHADGWQRPDGWPSIDELRGQLAHLRDGAEAVGRDPDTLRIVLNASAGVGRNQGEVDAIRQTLNPMAIPPLDGPMGTVDQILELLSTYRAEGVNAFYLSFPREDRIGHIQRFGEEIVARLT